MNEQLQQALAVLIEKTLAGMDASVSFLQAELPDVIQQLLMWKMVQSVAATTVPLALTALAIWICVRAYKAVPDDADEDHLMAWVSFISGVLSLVFCGAFLFMMNLTWLQIWLAPKVYLLEYAAQLAR